MVEENLHELTAAYALDALDDEQQRVYEEHLRHCARCRDELTLLTDAAGALAYGVDAPPPPPELRGRILAAARRENANVVPLRSRTAVVVSSSLAAAAACAAIGLGIWAGSMRSELERERSARDEQERVLEILADRSAERLALEGGEGTLVVGRAREGALILRGLEPAPEGKTYEAWVIEDGAPRPAGLFQARAPQTVLALTRPVPEDAIVAVTVEPESGSQLPTGIPLLRVRA